MNYWTVRMNRLTGKFEAIRSMERAGTSNTTSDSHLHGETEDEVIEALKRLYPKGILVPREASDPIEIRGTFME